MGAMYERIRHLFQGERQEPSIESFMSKLSDKLNRTFQDHLTQGKIDKAIPRYGLPSKPLLQPHRMWLGDFTAERELHFSAALGSLKKEGKTDVVFLQTNGMRERGEFYIVSADIIKLTAFPYEPIDEIDNPLHVKSPTRHELKLCREIMEQMTQDISILDPPPYFERYGIPIHLVTLADQATRCIREKGATIPYSDFL